MVSKNKKNRFITVFLLSIIFTILNAGTSNAVLQSNGNASATYNLSDWIKNVRKMEEIGGAMGLSETLNSNLTSSSESNNIDVHMEKNSEYGALAILSASSYGNPNKVETGGTTTGNITGVVMNLNKEWVAAQVGESNVPTLAASASRYRNIYEGYFSNYVPKSGDALKETAGWHSSSSSTWNDGTLGPGGLLRSYYGSLFSYYAQHWKRVGTKNQYYDAYYDKTWSTRAVVVVGERNLTIRR